MPTAPKPARFAHRAMHAEFALFVDPEDAATARGLSGDLWKRIDDLESRISSWLDSSDLGQLHHAAPNTPVVLSADTFACLSLAVALHQRTAGAFDITLGPVTTLWKKAAPKPPAPEALREARARTGLQHLHLDPNKRTATLQQPGMRLDLGGIAKGYALDVCTTLLADYGIDRWLLSAGGSTLLAGRPPRATPAGWTVGLGKNVPAGFLRHRALSASGTLFRGDHVIDPRTGHPGTQPVTRAWSNAPAAALADAMSTAALILDPSAIRKACAGTPTCGVRWLKTNGKRVEMGSWSLAGPGA